MTEAVAQPRRILLVAACATTTASNNNGSFNGCSARPRCRHASSARAAINRPKLPAK